VICPPQFEQLSGSLDASIILGNLLKCDAVKTKLHRLRIEALRVCRTIVLRQYRHKGVSCERQLLTFRDRVQVKLFRPQNAK
jgi:hypothetical protein